MPRQSNQADPSAAPPSRHDAVGPRLFARLAARLGSRASWPTLGRTRLLAIPILASTLAACGSDHHYYDDDPNCNAAFYPAVRVYFVDATTGQRTIIGVNGSIYQVSWSEEMTSPEPGYGVDGRTSVLEGGFGRVGSFDVSLITRAGERYDWAGVQVFGDYCRINTVELEAPIHFPDP